MVSLALVNEDEVSCFQNPLIALWNVQELLLPQGSITFLGAFHLIFWLLPEILIAVIS